ncbi:MAG TPA: nucleotidyl transferase AbiEii/AbiGii toxin family protein [Acidimicrobiales bacterium]|nr:nucleotidyl transferase AbiEii/AbiGii toxin family protein [Acidimicrobiales bacterium]
MSDGGGLRRRWGSRFELADLLEAMPGGTEVGVRDFALITLTGQLSARFPRQLVFKGGFVLRHVHGFLRFSKDVDATRHEPPHHKLDSAEVAEAIRQASIRNLVQFTPDEPATDTARSLDFDNVRVYGETFSRTSVQVEVSYREAVVDDPVEAAIGPPFYDEFQILTMTKEEMAAEKLRALAQRIRATDLADLAALLSDPAVSDDAVGRLARSKFELVAAGQANRIDRASAHLQDMADTYDVLMPGLFPGASSYRDAMEIVWPRIRALIP